MAAAKGRYCATYPALHGKSVGRHSLALLNRSDARPRQLVAIDIMPVAADIMRERGIEHAFCVDILASDLYPESMLAADEVTGAVADADAGEREHTEFAACAGERAFDLVLMLSDTLGFVGTLARLRVLLRRLHHWLADGGRVVLDCSDIERELRVNAEQHRAYVAAQAEDAYIGESRMHFEHEGKRGESFLWLYVSFERLSSEARNCGWTCTLLERDGSEYLAEMRRTTKQ